MSRRNTGGIPSTLTGPQLQSHQTYRLAQQILPALGIIFQPGRPSEHDALYLDNDTVGHIGNRLVPSRCVRFALTTKDNLQDNWEQVYHGTSTENVISILKTGKLLRSGEVKEEVGHWTHPSEFPATFTTPSPIYAFFYSKSSTIAVGERFYHVSFVMQAKQNPNSTNVLEKRGAKWKNTLANWNDEHQLDTRCSNNVLEYWTKDNDHIQVYGLLMRISELSPLEELHKLRDQRITFGPPCRGACSNDTSNAAIHLHPVETPLSDDWKAAAGAAGATGSVVTAAGGWSHDLILITIGLVMLAIAFMGMKMVNRNKLLRS